MELNRCKRCVMPDTRPDTEFVEGICSACIAYESRPRVDWGARSAQLDRLLARARRYAQLEGHTYDCIVPSSGGKDSHHQVIALKARGMRPLVVTATTCHLTQMGRLNIDNLARYASTIEVTPDRTVRAKLCQLGLTLVGDISWPEHVAIFTTPFRIARAMKIPFLFYGENPQNQYGGPLESLDAMLMTRRWVAEFGGFLGLRPQDLIGVQGLTEDDMADYMLSEGEADGLEAHFLGQYLPWDSHKNAEVARVYGMLQGLPCKANWWPHENLDNAQTGLHDYLMFLKYGYGRGCAQISVDVREGTVSRETALAWVKENDGRFPSTYAGVGVAKVLGRIGVTLSTLDDVCEKFRGDKP